MAKGVKTYSASSIKIVLGAHIITGVAEETFVTIEPQSEGTTSESGAYGDVARALSLDKRHDITITLQQTSASNSAMTALYQLDQASNGDGTFPVLITDLRGKVIFNGEGWIPRMPSAEFAAALSEREWNLEAVGDLEL